MVRNTYSSANFRGHNPVRNLCVREWQHISSQILHKVKLITLTTCFIQCMVNPQK